MRVGFTVQRIVQRLGERGAAAADLDAAEQRLGLPLPAALREAYLLFGRRDDLHVYDGSWLMVKARTPEALDAVRASVPGDWVNE